MICMYLLYELLVDITKINCLKFQVVSTELETNNKLCSYLFRSPVMHSWPNKLSPWTFVKITLFISLIYKFAVFYFLFQLMWNHLRVVSNYFYTLHLFTCSWSVKGQTHSYFSICNISKEDGTGPLYTRIHGRITLAILGVESQTHGQTRAS